MQLDGAKENQQPRMEWKYDLKTKVFTKQFVFGLFLNEKKY